MKLKLGYLKQFINLFGISKGTKLYFNLSLDKFKPFVLPNVMHPIKLRKGTSDLRAFYQVFINQEYELKVPFEPQTIIDGGANIGLFSILMANKYSKSQIISIEPDPDNFKLLEVNLKNYSNTTLINAGIWNKKTRLNVYDKYDSGSWGMVVEENLDGEIEAISIDYILENYQLSHIDILKLDIETSEKNVFSKDYQSWLPKVRLIIIELHDWLEPGCSKAFFDAINQTINSYELIICGENIVIVNNDLS